MRRLWPIGAVLGTILVVACGGGGSTGTNPNEPAFVIINGKRLDTVFTYGPSTFSALVLNANREELAAGTFVQHWSTSDPTIATANDAGTLFALRDGTVKLIARVGSAADTITVVVRQKATRVLLDQDTIVGLKPGATVISGTALTDLTMKASVHAADANGNPAPLPSVVSWSAPANANYSIVFSSAGGDTVGILGITPGTSTIIATLGGASFSFPVQVAGSYAVVRIIPSQMTAFTSPDVVTIPAGAAVVFVNTDSDADQVIGNSAWTTALIPNLTNRGREAQEFDVPGTYTYRINTHTGTVIVQ
ncbi:MAG: cupredoxin domain-containing protein [Gemmatimonadaceae bacterium]